VEVETLAKLHFLMPLLAELTFGERDGVAGLGLPFALALALPPATFLALPAAPPLDFEACFGFLAELFGF